MLPSAIVASRLVSVAGLSAFVLCAPAQADEAGRLASPADDAWVAGAGGATPGFADLDARRSAALQERLPAIAALAAARTTQAVSWGRWESMAGQSPNASANLSGAQRLAVNDGYALFRGDDGAPFVMPARGKTGFALAGGDATVRDTLTGQRSAATLANGRLDVDFNTASFATRVDVRDQADVYQLAAHGNVGRDGQFASAKGNTPANNMQVTGALSGNGAAYLFESRLTPRRVISGATFWRAATVR